MRLAIVSILASMICFGCKNEPARDVDPCASASANARRLAASEPSAAAEYGTNPLPVERCRTLRSREEVSCLGYASSWKELTECSSTALRPGNGLAGTR
jgi:hypothetical protein